MNSDLRSGVSFLQTDVRDSHLSYLSQRGLRELLGYRVAELFHVVRIDILIVIFCIKNE